MLGFGLLGLALTGCTGPLSALDPAGDSARQIFNLSLVLFVGAAVIFVGVMAAALLALLPRRRPWPVDERLMLVGGGLVFPGVTLLALTVAALVLGEQLKPDPGTLRIAASARQWHWEFTYTEPGGARLRTRNVLHVPAGQPFQAEITSSDVIHSFWVPRLGGKIDAVPGKTNLLQLRADEPGDYEGRCAEFCGLGHTTMRLLVRAHPPERYQELLREAAAADARR